MAHSFENLESPSGLGKLNGFLADRSYIEGYTPTQADAGVFAEVSRSYGQGPDKKFVNVLRWFNHIHSFSEDERRSFPSGESESVKEPQKEKEKEAQKEEKEEKKDGGEEDDFDVFGEVDAEEAEKEKKRREDEKNAKKKEEPVQKSNIVLDVKPWDDETDMDKMEALVRGVVIEGLTWGPSKFVEIAYGIRKLQISCVVVDELVSTDDLDDAITAFADHVQSVDIAAFVRV